LSKPVAYIAIVAMFSVPVLVAATDVLKYGFASDPAKQELEKKKKKKMMMNGKRTIMVIRYLYVHSSTPPTQH
jgi:hypothetical protein